MNKNLKQNFSFGFNEINIFLFIYLPCDILYRCRIPKQKYVVYLSSMVYYTACRFDRHYPVPVRICQEKLGTRPSPVY